MSTTDKRGRARKRGIRVAAKVATVVGIACAAMGAAEARESAPARADARVDSPEVKPSFSEWAKVHLASAGNCGCSPCWGPPPPPRKTARPIRRVVERKRNNQDGARR